MASPAPPPIRRDLATPRAGIRTALIPIGLLLVFVGQSVWFAHTQSLTTDEAPHLYAGLRAWRTGFIDYEVDSLPLPRLYLTLPLLAEGAEVDPAYPAGFIRPDVESVAVRARAMNTLLGVVLGALLWVSCRRLFSEGGANLALAFFVLSPEIVAHFSVVATDGATTLALFALGMQLAWWRQHQSWSRTLWLGVIAGLALAVKFSCLPLVVASVGLVAILRSDGIVFRPRELQLGRAAVVAVMALLVMWATCFFHTAEVSAEGDTLNVAFEGREEPLVAANPLPFDGHFVVPFADYLGGLARVTTHNQEGHIAFFLGEISRDGWWSYFPVAVLLKWPVVVVGLMVTALALIATRRIVVPDAAWLMLGCGALFFVLSLFARINIGVRHILPVYPFALLLLASLWGASRGRRTLRAGLLVAVALHAFDVARFAPDALGYFNPLVRPADAHRLLSDSNVDWGQGLLALRDYQQNHPDEALHLAYHGGVDPSVYGIDSIPLVEGEPVDGTVVVSAMLLSGHILDNPDGFAWLDAYPRSEILNHSLHVFRVDGSRSKSRTENRESESNR